MKKLGYVPEHLSFVKQHMSVHHLSSRWRIIKYMTAADDPATAQKHSEEHDMTEICVA
jgi:hypothetical protein